LENFLSEKFSSKNAKFEAERNHFGEIWGQIWNFVHPASEIRIVFEHCKSCPLVGHTYARTCENGWTEDATLQGTCVY